MVKDKLARWKPNVSPTSSLFCLPCSMPTALGSSSHFDFYGQWLLTYSFILFQLTFHYRIIGFKPKSHHVTTFFPSILSPKSHLHSCAMQISHCHGSYGTSPSPGQPSWTAWNPCTGSAVHLLWIWNAACTSRHPPFLTLSAGLFFSLLGWHFSQKPSLACFLQSSFCPSTHFCLLGLPCRRAEIIFIHVCIHTKGYFKILRKMGLKELYFDKISNLCVLIIHILHILWDPPCVTTCMYYITHAYARRFQKACGKGNLNIMWEAGAQLSG